METPVPTPPSLTVDAPDGVALGVFARGTGPPLVLVHGSMQDHTVSVALEDELARDFTCYSMDRRGFGSSGDTSGYRIEREFDDVAAVVDHVAGLAGQPVHLWGHSFGASCAMGGAARTPNVGRLVLYEPSLGLSYRPGSIDEIDAAVDAGDNDTAIALVFREILGVSDSDIAAMRATPEWQGRLAVAHTVAREARAEQDWVWQPGQFDGIDAATLLLSGSDSPDELKDITVSAAAAIPGARVLVLDGHAHFAHRRNPAEVAAIIREFCDQS